MSEQKIVNPQGNWFQRFGTAFGNEWGKTNLLQKMGLQHDPNKKGIGINPLMANPITAVGGLTSWALQKANRDHTGTDTMVQGGINVAKDRPGGLMRGLTGTVDFLGDLTGQSWDFDRQGQGFGNVKSEGIGSLGQGYELVGGVPKIKKGYEAVDPLEKGGGAQKEGTREKEDGSAFQDKLNQLEAMGERGANRNLIRSQIANFPALMAAGGMAKAEAFKGIAEQSSRWGEAIVNNPYYPAVQKWNPATPINYNLGRSSLK